MRSALLPFVFAAAPLLAQNVPGQSYFGTSDYIEYIAGNLPVIVAAPHGGSLKPVELPDRTYGTTTIDSNTQDLARKIQQAFLARFGGYPHVIICRLHREKIDCNREIVEGAQGHAPTETAWTEFQDFISAARQSVTAQFGRGLFLDIHGHGHTLQRLELGYLLHDTDLDLSDSTLDAGSHAASASIRNLDVLSPVAFSQLLRGANSLGGLLATRGYPSVPSPAIPSPGTDLYFDGGYNTLQHGSRDAGTISAVQIECNFTGVRDSAANRTAFATELASAADAYFGEHFALDLRTPLTSWNQANFGANWNNAAIAGELVDIDRDGLCNLLEYALAGAPADAAQTPLPQSSVVAGHLSLTFTRVLANTDLTTTVQVADSAAGPWTDLARSTAGATTIALAAGAGVSETGTGATRTVEVQDIETTGDPAHPRRFMRVRVEK